MVTGHPQDAIEQALAAHELDPLSPFVETGLGQLYYFAGDPQEAVQRIRKVVQSDPTFFPGHYYLGVAYLFAERYNDAIREFEAAGRLDPDHPGPVAHLAYAHAMLGRKEQAGAWLKRLNGLKDTTNISPYLFAVVHAGLGDPEQAIGFLQKAYRDRDDFLILLKLDHVFNRLHSDPRYQELVNSLDR